MGTRIDKVKRNRECVDRMWDNPEVFYNIQQNYEAMINLTAIMDIVVQDVQEHAPFLFYGKAQCFKRLTRALDECMEWIRTDPLLFGARDPKLYEEQIMTSFKLLNIVKGVLLRCNTNEGLMQADTLVKLHIVTPQLERADKYRIAHETLRRHGHEFTPEVRQKWEAWESKNK